MRPGTCVINGKRCPRSFDLRCHSDTGHWVSRRKETPGGNETIDFSENDGFSWRKELASVPKSRNKKSKNLNQNQKSKSKINVVTAMAGGATAPRAGTGEAEADNALREGGQGEAARPVPIEVGERLRWGVGAGPPPWPWGTGVPRGAREIARSAEMEKCKEIVQKCGTHHSPSPTCVPPGAHLRTSRDDLWKTACCTKWAIPLVVSGYIQKGR